MKACIVRRGPDRDARDSGQWGVSFKYMFDPLDTEFGAYFMNYHSRAPIFSGHRCSGERLQRGGPGGLAGGQGVPLVSRVPGADLVAIECGR